MLPNGSTKGYGIAKHFLSCDLIGCSPSREVLSTVKCFEDLDGDFVCLKTSGSRAWSLWSHLPICSGILCCSPSKFAESLHTEGQLHTSSHHALSVTLFSFFHTSCPPSKYKLDAAHSFPANGPSSQDANVPDFSGEWSFILRCKRFLSVLKLVLHYEMQALLTCPEMVLH